jgi:hypothetical protein
VEERTLRVNIHKLEIANEALSLRQQETASPFIDSMDAVKSPLELEVRVAVSTSLKLVSRSNMKMWQVFDAFN